MKEAEKILNKFIKGDIARDYDEESRKHHTITLRTALEAINVALNKSNVSGQLPNNLIIYRQAKKLNYADFCKWINAKLGNLR